MAQGVTDEGDGAGRSPAEQAFLRYLALRRSGDSCSFEEFLTDQPPELRPELEGLHENWLSLEHLLGDALEGRSIANVFDSLGRSLGPTRDFEGLGPEGSDEVLDSEALLKRLASGGDFVTRYEVDREIAHGGMGIIHRVWDRRLGRFLAMKVMRPPRSEAEDGAEDPVVVERALQRFHTEALVTAQLDHPGILPVHDVGVDDRGRVYFTMKYVKGRRNLRRIFDMVARNQEGWTVNRAVGSILRVCEAVAYAHSKHVLHRDIKPANVMVGQYGETYLLDWGLARRLDAPDVVPPALPAFVPELPPGGSPSDLVQMESWLFSRDGKIMGTPPYMSPEQARGEIHRVCERSDLYALGALLYHLLTGRPPFVEADEHPYPIVVLLRVQSQLPRSVRELAPDAPLGLVEICEKAMNREPEGRYASASEMARDLEDYLEDISEAREEARRQAQRATMINEFLVRMLSSADPRRAQGQDVTVVQLLDQFSARVEGGLAGMPRDEAALRRTLGTVYKELGRFEPAKLHLERALALFEDTLGFDHPETLAAGTDLAVLLSARGDLDGAEGILLEVADVQTQKLGPDHRDTLRTRMVLAEVLRRGRGRLAEAEAILRRVVAGREQQLGPDHIETLVALNRLAMALWEQDRTTGEAEALLRRAVAGLREQASERHPETLVAMNDLAGMLQGSDRIEEAEDLCRRTLAGQRVVLGDEHPETIMSLANLGWLLNRRNRLEEAEQVLTEAVRRQSALLGAESADTLVYRNNLAKTIDARGRPREALELFEDVVAVGARQLSPRNWHLARFRSNLGCCLMKLGQLERARVELTLAGSVLLAELGATHPFTLEAQQACERLDGLARGGTNGPSAEPPAVPGASGEGSIG